MDQSPEAGDPGSTVAATNIPVRAEGVAAPDLTDGVTHVEGTTDQPDESGRVEHDKAEDMAYASKPDLDEANQQRQTIRNQEALLGDTREFLGMPTNTDKRLNAARQRQDELLTRANTESVEGHWRGQEGGYRLRDAIDYGRMDVNGVLAEDSVRISKRELEAGAAESEKRAEEVQAWAAILHEHPVGESYRATHEGVELDARSLAEMERHVGVDLDKVQVLDEALERLPATGAVDGIGDRYLQNTNRSQYGGLRPYEVMTDAYGQNPRESKSGRDQEQDQTAVEKWNEWLELWDNPETTLAQLRDVYKEAFRVAHIEPRRSYANSAKSVLEDVRSGRAAG